MFLHLLPGIVPLLPYSSFLVVHLHQAKPFFFLFTILTCKSSKGNTTHSYTVRLPKYRSAADHWLSENIVGLHFQFNKIKDKTQNAKQWRHSNPQPAGWCSTHAKEPRKQVDVCAVTSYDDIWCMYNKAYSILTASVIDNAAPAYRWVILTLVTGRYFKGRCEITCS